MRSRVRRVGVDKHTGRLDRTNPTICETARQRCEWRHSRLGRPLCDGASEGDAKASCHPDDLKPDCLKQCHLDAVRGVSAMRIALAEVDSR